MRLKEQIEADIKKAMLARDKDDLRALRSIKSMIMLAGTEKGAAPELTEDAENKLLMKAAKQRKDAAAIYQEQGRNDLAGIELAELEIINRYLPQPLSSAELKDALEKIIRETGASGPGDIGKVMGQATRQLAGKADGKQIAEQVKNLLSK